MSFTTSCFVRVEDAEKRKMIIKQLENIGYLLNVKKGYVIVTDTSIRSAFVGMYSDLERRTGRIDCGTNIELFKALAAMRDDTRIGQWHIAPCHIHFEKLKECVQTESSKKSINSGEWFKPLSESLKFSFLGRFYWRQATAPEIIEHFNNGKK